MISEEFLQIHGFKTFFNIHEKIIGDIRLVVMNGNTFIYIHTKLRRLNIKTEYELADLIHFFSIG